jgi:hypothetical protein
MPLVITEKASIACANHGSIKPSASQGKLKVDGASVLVLGDLKAKPISGCTIVTDAQTAMLQCQLTVAEQGGVAAKLTVGGKGVLLQTVSGPTNGTLSGTLQKWSVSDAGQSKLKAS